MDNEGAAGVLELPSVPTEEQLLSSNSNSENQVNKGKSNTKDSTQATLEDCRSMLQQIMTHLGFPRAPVQRDEPATASAASLDVLAAATATDPPPPQQ